MQQLLNALERNRKLLEVHLACESIRAESIRIPLYVAERTAKAKSSDGRSHIGGFLGVAIVHFVDRHKGVFALPYT